jgi:hypothetical protein
MSQEKEAGGGVGLDLDEIEAAARACGPLNLDSAQELRDHGSIECPCCGGDGYVEAENDYCNFDGAAIGVQFYGVGNAHGAAERYLRAIPPATALRLVEHTRRSIRGLATPSVHQDEAPAISGYQPTEGETVTRASAKRAINHVYMQNDSHRVDEAIAMLEPPPMGGEPSDEQIDALAAEHVMVQKNGEHRVFARAVLKLYTSPMGGAAEGWVSVEERLPCPFKEVLVHPRPSDYCNEARVDTKGEWRYSEYDSHGDQTYKCRVTHWMPLPAAPQEGSQP